MTLGSVFHKVRDAVKPLVPLGVRRWLVRARHRLRSLTWRQRLDPDFVIIGCQRGGTSSLYRYLGLHPDISPSLRKETEFFTVNYGEGARWYRAHFPLRFRQRLMGIAGRRLLTFEATPDYLLDPRAPERCAAMLPAARIVVLLREPGERALSHYHHNRRLGLEDESFENALSLEEERIGADIATLASDLLTRATAFRRFSYQLRGDYADQLERWFSVYPRDRFLILESEEFFADPDRVLQQVLSFVGARRWSPPEFRNYSYLTKSGGGHEEVPEETRPTLDRRFSDPNARLAELLDEDIGWLRANR